MPCPSNSDLTTESRRVTGNRRLPGDVVAPLLSVRGLSAPRAPASFVVRCPVFQSGTRCLGRGSGVASGARSLRIHSGRDGNAQAQALCLGRPYRLPRTTGDLREMRETRVLHDYEARWAARIVAKAVWARMSGNSLETTDCAWNDKRMLLDDAFDAAVKHLPDNQTRAAVVRPGEDVPTVPWPSSARPYVDAFEALAGMPRDSLQEPGEAEGRAT